MKKSLLYFTVILLILMLGMTFFSCKSDSQSEPLPAQSEVEKETKSEIPSDTFTPTDPVDPTDPVNPSDPTNPSTPADPTEPTTPTEPTNPTTPTDPTEPSIPADPTEPPSPVDPPEDPDPDKIVLFLGDSIGEGIAGTAPITEREAYAYYGILGNINGYTYYNRAVTGYTSADLAALVRREDDGVNMVHSLISCADVIHISILGNDFLNSNQGQMMIDLSQEKYDSILSRQVNGTKNLEIILDTIHEFNPDAIIILQTLYNPAGPDSPLITWRARQVLAQSGIAESGYHELMNKMIVEINKILYDYLDAHTVENDQGEKIAPFELVDVYSAFEEVYERDQEKWARLFCSDGVHPNNEGHALIAAVLQEKLQSFDLTSSRALTRYQTLRTEQLERLYAESVDLEEGTARILACTTFEEVTDAYFDLVKDKIPHYAIFPTLEGAYFTEERYFTPTLADAFEESLLPYLNTDLSGIYFDTEGNFEIYLELKSSIVRLLKEMIAQPGGVHVSDMLPIGQAIPYFSTIAPGVDPGDLRAILQTVEEVYGMSFDGLDYDSSAMQTFFDRFRDTEDLIFDDPTILDNGYLAFSFKGRYRLETVTSPLTGETYQAIYLNNAAGKGEPFFRFTYDVANETIRMTVDVIHLAVEAGR